MAQHIKGEVIACAGADAVDAECIRMLMGSSLYIIVGAHLFSAALVVFGIGVLNPQPWLIPWGAAVLAVTALRAACILHWRKVGVRPENATPILVAFAALAAAAGGVWSAGAIIFFDPHDIAASVLLYVVLIGMATGGMGPLAASFPAYAAFSTMALLPFSLHLFLYESLLIRLTGVAGIFYWLCCLAAGSYLTSRIREFVALRFENQSLIADLEEKRREAEKANAAKGRFLAAASHDLRQPLDALSLAVDMLAAQPAGKPATELIRSIRSSVDATNDILTGLLDVSRLDAGVVRPEPREINLGPLFDQISEMFGPVALDRDVTLRVRPTWACVRSDPALLGSVLQNLVGNAIRYVDRGGCVLLAARLHHHRWRIEIRDNGPGIPADQQQRIFEDFTRCHPPGGGPGAGLGLGLAIVRRVTRLLGHRLRLRSRPGRGSIFAVELAEAVTHCRRERVAAGTGTSASVPLPVLLIAPDVAAREHLQGLLEARGLQVRALSGVNEACDLLGAGSIVPRVLLVDGHDHGEFDGIDVARLLAMRSGPDLPAVLLTEDVSSNLRRRARAIGIRLLRKPVTADRLLGAIGDLLPRTA